jgi:hypothetical protein
MYHYIVNTFILSLYYIQFILYSDEIFRNGKMTQIIVVKNRQ